MSLMLLLLTFIKICFVFAISISMVPLLVWFERRGSAWMQGRLGPNRVGPFGLFQLIADSIKFFRKEDLIPSNASKGLYMAAPILALVAPMAAIVSIPFGSSILVAGYELPLQIVQINSGVLLILAFAGLEIYPMILAGWASNNKYSLLGALRGGAQLISYEMAMTLAIFSAIIIYGTFDLREIVLFQQQQHLWGIFINPIGALIFAVTAFAETNRLPFDLAEGDAEIVAGYHTEYGAMKFCMFFMAEYVAMIMVSAFFATLFLGGSALLPGFDFLIATVASILNIADSPMAMHNLTAAFEFASLFLKVAFLMFVFIWVRWTLPRFRFDQLMHLGWNILFPLAMFNLIVVSIVAYFL